MAYVSIFSLRKYNQSIPVKVFFIEDGGALKTTNNQLDYNSVVSQVEKTKIDIISRYFIEEMTKLGVEVIIKVPHSNAPDFVHANRMYIEELNESNVFFIDSDTFIFGDVELIFDKYKNNDITTLPAPWIEQHRDYRDLSLKYFGGLNPFAGCLLFFRNHSAKVWARSIMLSIDKVVVNQDLFNWMKKDEYLFLIREEIALIDIVHSNKLNAGYFDLNDCCQIDYPKFYSSKIVHTFSHTWKDKYQEIFKTDVLPIKV